MKELTRILDEARRLRDRGASYALATVVRIDGSAYRRPGARMLVRTDGTFFGTISGGCLEGEVVRRSEHVLATGAPELTVFEVDEDDPFLGFGAGCGGTVYVLLEAVRPGDDASDALTLVEACFKSRTPGVLATVFGADDPALLGRHLLFHDTGTASPASAPLRAALHESAQDVLTTHRTQIVQYGGVHEPGVEGLTDVLFEFVQPPIHLWVFGDGPDAGPVATLGRDVGWHVTLIGRKPEGTLAIHFPDASRHLFLMHPGEALDHLTPDARTAAVVMNHNLVRDQALLATLLPAGLPYVGALGPRRRTDRMLEAARAEGARWTAEDEGRLHAPIGLDLGSETPEEIALAIVAEVQAALAGRSGTMLRGHDGPIHAAVPVVEPEVP